MNSSPDLPNVGQELLVRGGGTLHMFDEQVDFFRIDQLSSREQAGFEPFFFIDWTEPPVGGPGSVEAGQLWTPGAVEAVRTLPVDAGDAYTSRHEAIVRGRVDAGQIYSPKHESKVRR